MMKRGLIFAVILLISGCAASKGNIFMPSTQELAKGRWQGFEATEEFYNGLTPYQTKLSSLGFDLKKEPNVTELSYLDVVNLFLVNPSIKPENLPTGIQDCMKDPDVCRGFRVSPQDIHTWGEGDTLDLALRWMYFKKADRTTGWDAKFYLFAKGDMVVYKLWGGGTPNIDKTKLEKNPLGPFREFDSLFRFIPAM